MKQNFHFTEEDLKILNYKPRFRILKRLWIKFWLLLERPRIP